MHSPRHHFQPHRYNVHASLPVKLLRSRILNLCSIWSSVYVPETVPELVLLSGRTKSIVGIGSPVALQKNAVDEPWFQSDSRS